MMPEDWKSHLSASNHTSAGDGDLDDNQTFQSILDVLPRGDDGGVGAAKAGPSGRRRSTKARNKRLSALAPLIFVALVALLLIIFIILGNMNCTSHGFNGENFSRHAKVLEDFQALSFRLMLFTTFFALLLH